MRLYLRLLGVQLRQRFGMSVLRSNLREKPARTIGMAALWLIVVLSLGVLVGLYAMLLDAVIPVFLSLGMGTLLLGTVLLVSMVFVFFMGMVYLIGVLFFSKDTEFLTSLPIPQRTVFAAKFSQVLLGEIGTSLVILLPPFILYGIHTGGTAAYWLRMVAVSLLAPCIPLALSALLSLLLMRFNALWRRRDLMTIIGSLLLIAVVFLMQYFMTSVMSENMSMAAITALIADNEALLRMVVAMFPPSGWAASGLAGSASMLLLFVGVSAVALALVTLIAGRIYYRGAMAQLETSAQRKDIALTGKAVQRHGALRALFAREWRTVIRSPVYALNGLIVIIMGPLLMIIPWLFQGASGGEELEAVMSLLTTAVDTRIVLLLLAAMFMVISMLNPAVTTSISREGKQFYILRTIPVSPTRQVMAKYLFGLSVGVITMLLMGGTAVLVLGITPQVAALAFLLGIVASIAPLALSILPDVLRPKLSWNSETEAIKQNFNSMLGMLIGWGYAALVIFGAVKAIGAGMDTGLLTALAAGGSVVLGALSLLGLSLAARHSWRAIEG